MSEELTQEALAVEESPQGENETVETDWKAEARKWERYAKKAQAAEQELEQLKASQMSEQERERAAREAAEAELAALKAEKARTEAAQRIAADTGVPLDLLMLTHCPDEESLTIFAKAYAKEIRVGAAPSALGGRRIVRGEDKPRDNGELFAEFAEKHFKQ